MPPNYIDKDKPLETYDWKEIKKHTDRKDCWIVINDHIYDVTEWQHKHPGGGKILGHYAGQDATGAWTAMHKHRSVVEKYMAPMLVGRVSEKQFEDKPDILALQEDFDQLRRHAEKSGWFKSNPLFYAFHTAHIIALEMLAITFLWYYGVSTVTFLITSFILAISQAQAGWSQHDYGHHSVFKSNKDNRNYQRFIINVIKGVNVHWWQFRHNQHHAKPNIYKKDPDITLPHLFLLGDHIPKLWGDKKRGNAPYQFQQFYFLLFGPMTLLPIYFHLEVLYFSFKHRDYFDFGLMLTCFIRFFGFFIPILGGWWPAFGMYMLSRFWESFWFTLVTQMSHLPMEIDFDQDHDWVTGQVIASQNVTPGVFNDWFTGGLNYQIEHHLFPMMPRHNFDKVAPLVQSLCKKHNVPYTCVSLRTAISSIFWSLAKSGRIWHEAYHSL